MLAEGDGATATQDLGCPLSAVAFTRAARDAGSLRGKLREAKAEREALDVRIKELKTELRLSEVSRDAIAETEAWLEHQVSNLEKSEASDRAAVLRLSLDDFITTSVSCGGASSAEAFRGGGGAAVPRARSPRAQHPCSARSRWSLPKRSRREEPDPIAPLCYAGEEADMGFGRDTATCSICGRKFPLDAEAIEAHGRDCRLRTKQVGSSRRCLSEEPCRDAMKVSEDATAVEAPVELQSFLDGLPASVRRWSWLRR